MHRLVATALVVSAAATGCTTSRPPLEVTRTALTEATTHEARVSVAAARLAAAGATPLGDGRVQPHPADIWRWGAPPVVAGLVPGQGPVQRSDLVTLVTALDGPTAAETIEAARRLVAARPHGQPHRSVLVALWPAGLAAAEGVALVRRLPVWPDSLRTATLVVGPEAVAEASHLDPRDEAGGEMLVARIADAALALARGPSVPPDSLAAATSSPDAAPH